MRELLDTGFGDDTGDASPELVAALGAYARDEARYGEALAELASSRVLVPVVAVLAEVEVDAQGLAHDKTSDMAAVLMQGADGRVALLAFTSTRTLAAWDPGARPVPVSAPHAALAAVQEDAAALVVDVAGPVRFVVEGDELALLARAVPPAPDGAGSPPAPPAPPAPPVPRGRGGHVTDRPDD